MSNKENQWLLGGDTGISSKVIWAVMTGNNPIVVVQGTLDAPRDPSDFGRCYRLLQEFPEWQFRLNELRNISKNWRTFADSYLELVNLWLEESPSGNCPKMYDKMKELGF